MATFLIYREYHDVPGKNSSGIHACLANGGDESEARATARAASHLVKDFWAAVQVSSGDLPAEVPSVTLIEGDVLHPGALTRGGSKV